MYNHMLIVRDSGPFPTLESGAKQTERKKGKTDIQRILGMGATVRYLLSEQAVLFLFVSRSRTSILRWSGNWM